MEPRLKTMAPATPVYIESNRSPPHFVNLIYCGVPRQRAGWLSCPPFPSISLFNRITQVGQVTGRIHRATVDEIVAGTIAAVAWLLQLPQRFRRVFSHLISY